MHIGVVYPQAEIATDVGAVRAFAARVEDLGYHHILAYDHVVGADPAIHTDWRRPYDIETTFHEPLVLYGFLAGIARLELVTGVIISPQRQTVLLAKQAAEVDILTGGRFRLGLGIGWNTVEYEALGQDFKTRGRRQEEQVELLRRLWTERSVTHKGRFDRVTGAGIWPLPVQRPIPIWLGGSSVPAYRRAGRLADGWFPQMGPGPELDEAIAVVQKAAVEAGRDPAALGMEGRLVFDGRDTDALVRTAQQWQDAAPTHLAVNTLEKGLSGLDAHLDALAVAADALRVREKNS